MNPSPSAAVAAALIGVAALAPSIAPAQAADLTAKSVVLVHGAFADGSSWNRVVPMLLDAGLTVHSVQNPLSSLEDDVEHTTRALERAEGPVVLVGHSWGGVVITEAGVHDKVASLVYVAAYAPSEGQSLVDTAAGFPKPEGIKSLVKDDAGYFSLPADAVANYFAQDLPKNETAVMAATQGPINSVVLDQKVGNVAWREKPSWYAVSLQDNMTHPDLQKALVKKIGATSVELDASHTSMLSKPRDIAELIIDAAK